MLVSLYKVSVFVEASPTIYTYPRRMRTSRTGLNKSRALGRPGRLKILQSWLIFVGPQYGTCFLTHWRRLELGNGSLMFENVCTTLVNIKICRVNSVFMQFKLLGTFPYLWKSYQKFVLTGIIQRSSVFSDVPSHQWAIGNRRFQIF